MPVVHNFTTIQKMQHDDARDIAQFLYENPEYKVLFDASRNVKKEDIVAKAWFIISPFKNMGFIK